MSQQQPPMTGPPYPPHVAGVGGMPSVLPDVPVCAVFIVLYLTFFVSNIGLFTNNRRKGHFFLPSGLMGGFSMARVLTCSLRIGWATHQTNISLAIAAMIFVNAGILIIYIINILFAQRILRAKQPALGWHRLLKAVFIMAYALIAVSLILVIVLTVMTFYTLDMTILTEGLWIQRGAVTYLLIVTIFPFVLLALAHGLPRSDREETFGHGPSTPKPIILFFGICLCVTIAGFKAGTLWMPPRPVDDPAWYQSKAAFYVFNFTLEIIILTLYTSARVDKRFHVPNGSSKRRTYAISDHKVEDVDNGEGDIEKQDSSLQNGDR